MTERLEQAEIERSLTALSGWTLTGGRIVLEKSFPDFLKAMEYVNRVALIAEGMGHHPDIEIHYNRVALRLWTHSAGGITSLDIDLATAVHAIG